MKEPETRVRRTRYLVGLAFTPVILLAACSDSATPRLGEIRASGFATVSGEPDIAVLSLGVVATRSTVSEARDAAASALSAVVSAVRGADVEEDDVRTSSFSIQPRYQYLGAEARFMGHEVSNILTVTVRDIAAAGTVIDRAIAAGGASTRVQHVGFRVADTASLEREARRLAVQDATEKADFYAAELGLGRGAILSVSDQVGVPYPVAEGVGLQRRMVAESAGASTEFFAGDFEVSAQVEVVFAIE